MAAVGKFLRSVEGNQLMAYCPGCQYAHPFDLNRWQYNNNPDSPTFSPSLLCNAGIEIDILPAVDGRGF